MDLRVLKSQWDRAAALVLTLAGVICVVAGYARVAESTLLAEQTRYIVSGGIGGIFLLGLGATVWISADLRDEWRKLDRIERALASGVLRWTEDGAAPSSQAPNRSDAAGEVPLDLIEPAGFAPGASSREHA